MNVPPSLIKCIKLLYSNPSSHIIINNCIGSPIQVKRGKRQGCPLSPLLYATCICAEGLAVLIRNNINLKGIGCPRGECSIQLIQHADDTRLFVSSNNEFSVISDILETYCRGSGSKINVNKSKGLWLGSWRNRKDKPCNFCWDNKYKIIGIIVGNAVEPADDWSPRISKMQCTLDKWSKRNLTLNGKVVIVNTLVGAGINYMYHGNVISCPDDLTKKMSNMIWNFFWDSKRDQIKKDTITGPKGLGGMGRINCKLMSLKLQWLSHYSRESGKWKNLFDYWISKASGANHSEWYIFANVKKPLKTKIFYTDVISAFQKAGGKFECNCSSLLECGEVPLWQGWPTCGPRGGPVRPARTSLEK